MPTTPVSTANVHLSSSAGHEHSGVTESRHRVSDGVLLYVRCSRCGARRVDLQSPLEVVPAGVSRLVIGVPALPPGPARR